MPPLIRVPRAARLAAAALLAFGAPSAAPLVAQPTTVTFDFASTPLDTPTPFVVAHGGFTAAFDALDFGQVRYFTPGFMPGMDGHVLGAIGGPAHPPIVSIAFSAPATGIALDFLLTLVGPDPVPVTLTAFRGAAVVGASSAAGALVPGLLPLDWRQAGPLAFVGAPFDRVVITTEGLPNLYLDGVVVQATPEPPAAALLPAALLLCAAAAARRGRAR